MAEILNFLDGRGKVKDADVPGKKEELAAFVFSCGACGNTTFQLVRGGSLRCAHCNTTCSTLVHFNPKEPA